MKALLFTFPLLFACAGLPRDGWISPLSTGHPLVGQIWDTQAHRFVQEAEVAQKARAARYVLLGEKHDNADHHRLQAKVLEWVLAAAQEKHVVFEMIAEEKQPVIDAQLKAAPQDADALARAVEWSQSGWPEWETYRPVFVAAMAHRSPLIGAMLSPKRSMGIAKGEADLGPALVERHGLTEALAPELEAGLLKELKEGHCGHLPEERIPGMLAVQRARDALLAEHLLGSPNGAALIAGSGHVRRDWAVPRYLERLGEKSMVVVQLIEVSDEKLAPEGYLDDASAPAPYDFLWFTPRANDRDYCQELEEQLKKHHPKS